MLISSQESNISTPETLIASQEAAISSREMLISCHEGTISSLKMPVSTQETATSGTFSTFHFSLHIDISPYLGDVGETTLNFRS
jgi:hypothetical protein